MHTPNQKGKEIFDGNRKKKGSGILIKMKNRNENKKQTLFHNH